MAAATAPSSGAGACDAPEWLGCDLLVCRVLQGTSAEIVATCRSFGDQLQGVCGQAIEKLGPAKEPDGTMLEPNLAWQDECFGFLQAFGTLSSALLQLASDLESTVTRPIEKTIATLVEESSGRRKHWQQVRSRFAELQERYRRSRQRNLEARSKLAGSSKGRSGLNRAASEQHAAMCDLARCEEELQESEASLRNLEEESRERLSQLDRQKWVQLSGALTQGRGSLRRLLPVVDHVPKPKDASEDTKEWSGVLPHGAGAPELVGGSVGGGESDSLPQTPEAAASATTAAERAPTPEGCGAMASAPRVGEGRPSETLAASAEVEVQLSTLEGGTGPAPGEGGAAAASVDPSAKYLPAAGSSGGLQIHDLGGISDESETEVEAPEDAALRAQNWSPEKLVGGQSAAQRAATTAAARKKRGLVFQGDSCSLVAESRVFRRGGDGPSPAGSKACRPSGPSPAGAAPLTLARLADFAQEGAPSSARAAVATAIVAPHSEPTKPSPALHEVQVPEVPASWTAGESGAALTKPLPAVAPAASSSLAVTGQRATQPTAARHDETSSDSDDDKTLAAGRDGLGKELGPTAEQLILEVSPVVAEHPQRCFERYAARLGERLSGATETAWEKLQARASEHVLGGHVGKLDTFWIHEPGGEATPEAARGVVSFQFVQGCASNYARVLHLSVVGKANTEPWRELSTAILEVRRFIFAMLPVDSVRSVVLTGEDENGRMYVDRDLEAAYKAAGFRWFQLTQQVRRTRSAFGRERVKKSSRIMVLHTPRGPQEVKPRGGLTALPALCFRNSGGEDGSAANHVEESGAGGMPSFSEL